MSLTTVPPARGGAMPAAPSSAPTPRALIDYDFQTVLRVPPKRRLVLWLMVGLIAVAAIALAVLKVDIVVSANAIAAVAIRPTISHRTNRRLGGTRRTVWKS